MKNIKYYIASLVALAFVGCDTDFDFEDRGFDLQELPNYVAFNPDGTSVTFADVDVAEDDDPEDISIEIPGGTLSDVTVNYTISGDAVFGTDYTIEGATSTGGTLVIALTTVPNQDGLPINGNIVVTPLEDGVEDGDKTLTLTIV